jgi:phosphatidylglycerophosphate synthase
MRVAGMSVLERVLRDGARRGQSRAIVRGDAAALPRLPALPIDIDVVAPDADVPADAERVRGDALLGRPLASERERREVEWALMQTCRRPYDGPGDRYVIRSLSLRITRALTRTALSPNHVTLFAMAIGGAAVALAAAGGCPAIAIAGALMIAQVVLDSVDGELSRIRHMGSRLGMWLDNLSDDVIDNALVAALGIGLGGPWAIVGLAAAAARGFSALVTYLGARALGKPGDVMAFRWWFESAETPEQAYAQPLSPGTALRALGRRDTYMLVFGASCIATVPEVAFGLGVINSAVYFGMAVLHLIARKGRL